jgi:hypothetical protein
MEMQAVEAVFEQEMLRLGAVPSIAELRRPQRREGFRRPVEIINVGHADLPDAAVVRPQRDDEGDPGRILPLVRLAGVALVRERAEWLAAPVHEGVRLRRGDRRERLGVRRLERAQVDALANHDRVTHRAPPTA